MNLLLYLIGGFFYRILEFFEHWYVRSFRIYSHSAISILEKLDRTLAWKITLVNLSQPLYQDRSAIGYILGFIFRLLRLLIGAVVYSLVIAVIVIIYAIWLAIPVYLAYQIVRPLL